MSEVKNWLLSLGIPGIERLTEEFESRGFSTRTSLQYLQDGDLGYIFSLPKRLLLAEKRALIHELQKIKSLKSQANIVASACRKFCSPKRLKPIFRFLSPRGFQIGRNSYFSVCKIRWSLNLHDFPNKWRTNSIPWLRNPSVFYGYKVSHVIGQNTINIPEIFSVFTVFFVWV